MVEHWVRRYFSKTQVAEVMEILATYGTETWHREPERVCRDLIMMSRGSMAKLKELTELAKTDYRDILVSEEVNPWVIGELKKYKSC